MIFGRVHIANGAVQTHRDSYLIKELSVVSVRRPCLAPALMICGATCAFLFGFSDLLYPGEMIFLTGVLAGSLLLGVLLGRSRLLSRDLRGSELSGVIFGSAAHLNCIRRDISAAIQNEQNGARA